MGTAFATAREDDERFLAKTSTLFDP